MVIVVDGASGIRSSHVVAKCISGSLCKGMLSFNMELFSFYSALLVILHHFTGLKYRTNIKFSGV